MYYTKASRARLLKVNGFEILTHKTVLVTWVGFANMCLKFFRMFGLIKPDEPDPLRIRVIRRLMNPPIAIPHGTTQFVVARVADR